VRERERGKRERGKGRGERREEGAMQTFFMP
jgi:hypothetical protein